MNFPREEEITNAKCNSENIPLDRKMCLRANRRPKTTKSLGAKSKKSIPMIIDKENKNNDERKTMRPAPPPVQEQVPIREEHQLPLTIRRNNKMRSTGYVAQAEQTAPEKEVEVEQSKIPAADSGESNQQEPPFDILGFYDGPDPLEFSWARELLMDPTAELYPGASEDYAAYFGVSRENSRENSRSPDIESMWSSCVDSRGLA